MPQRVPTLHCRVWGGAYRVLSLLTGGSGAGDTKLGTFVGVFLPCVQACGCGCACPRARYSRHPQNLLGIHLFLRLTFVVGQAGTVMSTVIITASMIVVALTSLSLCALATNGARGANSCGGLTASSDFACWAQARPREAVRTSSCPEAWGCVRHLLNRALAAAAGASLAALRSDRQRHWHAVLLCHCYCGRTVCAGRCRGAASVVRTAALVHNGRSGVPQSCMCSISQPSPSRACRCTALDLCCF